MSVSSLLVLHQMLWILCCILKAFAAACIVGLCINFRKKTGAKSGSDLAAGKSASKENRPMPRSKASKSKVTKKSGTSTTPASTAGPPTVLSKIFSHNTDQAKAQQKSTSVPSPSTEIFWKVRNRSRSLEESTPIKEDLGDIQLVRPKYKRRDSREFMRERRTIEKRSSAEIPSETSSIDDTLHGVESLKTDVFTSYAPRMSQESLRKKRVSEPITNEVK
ncbi:unnamed protein product [Cylicocyclus nassatus]|uniref:Uncharacterized protein n=1 Tax=Cylicocyclus nassatus TaxID=53992 RepID=A0AA36MA60_CYLNA|nr:unnamed protein product [Cylicocyclus nassatus]